MKKLWLVFAQSVTVCLAVIFIISLFRNDLVTHTTVLNTLGSSKDNKTSSPYSFRVAAKKAMPSVVNIFTTKEVGNPHSSIFPNNPELKKFFNDNFPSQPEKQLSLGSGVIVMAKGYILTNDHVIDGAQEIQVVLSDGRVAKAEVVGTDPETDLAVLKINLNNLSPITYGSSTQVSVGDIAIAIGNPFGVGETVTMGIVSALGRNRLGLNTFENFIQTDAAINPGNSGGALVDANGDLIGINTAIYSKSGGSQGIGFSIPVSTAKNVMQAIIEHGEVVRGWIGVQAQDLTPELADSFHLPNTQGALLSGILSQGPADKAGAKPGDILIEVNGHPINDSQDMLNQVAMLTPNTQTTIKVLRNGKPIMLQLLVDKRPKGHIKNQEDQDSAP
ncbi:MAG: 2-alkenal reductase [Ferrovum sp. 37-45-19]|jgi:serine protease DegQ|uniref:Do family serine endopeptidase n=1 Tax=Ferrovum sp. JA12 TaxID=1356299 RepID=UPI0007030326|nr:Do family serine endopeptidase [Ferrovum sp. JA12]OYV79631.1 MAG: 2-alkenal reductase [Ferrovum sp. 21-44-67]OYV94574.1 MAG: 2-alkenal reductase [Ferrovum sp. 37-45-19]OZB32842.1 MAG: 2-alkenal reductase [Ferrovum sp. 34-44-207]HQT81559.1 Do family serine endopeptidase [Ferrovaceae bacterium]KRH79531.1 periplasmic pH-dependent serine endoprotease DegQ precursor [Ferrovum sp. JA12]